MAQTLFPELEKNFLIVRIPDVQRSKSMDAMKVYSIFKRHGITLEIPRQQTVRFLYDTPFRYPSLERKIAERYRRYYPGMEIFDVTVEPLFKPAGPLRYPNTGTLNLRRSQLQKSSGTFWLRHNGRRLRFRYVIDASLAVYKAKRQIKKDTIIAFETLQKMSIPFERWSAKPLDTGWKDPLIAIRLIGSGTVITENMVARRPDVLRHERAKCIMGSGRLRISFECEILRNGKIGDIVTVRNGKGKSFRGKVIRKGVVEIQ